MVNAPGAAVNLGAGRTALAVAVASHVCAILDDRSVKCWGNNSRGQLGDGTTTSTTAPGAAVNLGVGRTVLAISVGTSSSHTCAILDDRSLKCWGYNAAGQLGNGNIGAETSTTAPGAPVNLGAGRTAFSLAMGVSHTCVTLDDKSVHCWGGNYRGQVGNGAIAPGVASAGASVNLGAGRTGLAVLAGDSHSCALLDDRSLKCWGWNEFGQLGNGVPFSDVTVPGSPIALGAGRTVLSASAGRFHTCAILDDRSLKCWGSGQFGELGIASLAGAVHVDLPPSTPVNVGF